MPPEILHQIRNEVPEDHEATAADVKKVMRELKLTKYMENSGKQPPYIKREVEGKIMRMFNMIDRLWCGIEKDRRINFLNYYYIIHRVAGAHGPNRAHASSSTSQNQTEATSMRHPLEPSL